MAWQVVVVVVEIHGGKLGHSCPFPSGWLPLSSTVGPTWPEGLAFKEKLEVQIKWQPLVS